MGSVRRGEPVAGLEFYELLRDDAEFCTELGRAVLAAGRLEGALVRYLQREVPRVKAARATLGTLVRYAEERKLLSSLVPVLKMLTVQRNYLTHSIHALFSGLVQETILPKSGLLDSDVELFTERGWQLRENLEDLSEIVEKQVRSLTNQWTQCRGARATSPDRLCDLTRVRKWVTSCR